MKFDFTVLSGERKYFTIEAKSKKEAFALAEKAYYASWDGDPTEIDGVVDFREGEVDHVIEIDGDAIGFEKGDAEVVVLKQEVVDFANEVTSNAFADVMDYSRAIQFLNVDGLGYPPDVERIVAEIEKKEQGLSIADMASKGLDAVSPEEEAFRIETPRGPQCVEWDCEWGPRPSCSSER